MIDNAFSLDNLLDIINLEAGNNKRIGFDLKDIDFIMVDNISNLIAYTPSEKIQQFVEALIKIIRRFTAVYGIVIMDNVTNPEIQKLIEPFFDKSVFIKEEWL